MNAFICKNSSGRASRETFVFLNNYKFKISQGKKEFEWNDWVKIAYLNLRPVRAAFGRFVQIMELFD